MTRTLSSSSSHPTLAGWDGGPAWSPDGNFIAFQSSRAGLTQIYVMEADGSSVVRVTDEPFASFRPDWQPIPNHAPDCDATTPIVLEKKGATWRSIDLPTASDPDGDALVRTTLTVHQDEPVGRTTPDARLGDTLQVRYERDGRGDGRFYHVTATYADPDGATVECASLYIVPHPARPPVDQGPLYDSFG